MSRTAQEVVFTLLKVIKRHEEKRPEGRTELPKLKTTIAKSLHTNKTNGGEIPFQILRNADFSFEELKNRLNQKICNDKFLDTMKHADVSPVH